MNPVRFFLFFTEKKYFIGPWTGISPCCPCLWLRGWDRRGSSSAATYKSAERKGFVVQHRKAFFNNKWFLLSSLLPTTNHHISPGSLRAGGQTKGMLRGQGLFQLRSYFSLALAVRRDGAGRVQAEIQRKMRVWTVVKDTGRETETSQGGADTLHRPPTQFPLQSN